MKVCRTCAIGVNRNNKTGLCITCFRNDPEQKAKRAAGVRRAFQLRPELGEANRRNITALNKSPERRAQVAEASRRNNSIQHARSKLSADAQKRGGQTQSRKRLADIPAELLEDYLFLTRRKQIHAAEARAIIFAQHEANMADFRRKLGAA